MTTPRSIADFGVQTYCFRNFQNLPDVARMVCEIGVSSVELCGTHVDLADPKATRAAADMLSRENVAVRGIGVQLFVGEERERLWFESAAAVGAEVITAHFAVDSFNTAIPKVRRWSREFGVRVAIHCHGGWMFGGSPDEIDHLIGLGGPEIGVCIDTAWVLQIGPHRGDPIEWARHYAGSIYGVHFKDFVFDPRGRWQDVPVGSGNLDLATFVRELKAGGFDGYGVVEYEGDPENPIPALKECVSTMHRVLSK